jgi:hypothetical protein
MIAGKLVVAQGSLFNPAAFPAARGLRRAAQTVSRWKRRNTEMRVLRYVSVSE